MDPRDPAIEYKWCDIGMLDYDESTQLYLVQKLNEHGRVVDDSGQRVVNGGILDDGTYRRLSRSHGSVFDLNFPLTPTVAIWVGYSYKERQSARMSKITNDGLTRSGTARMLL